jgi:membrane protein implicated in regulation of membrane protease activity
MPWWGWITIGALMLAAELAFVDADFYLVLLGVSALLVGALDLSGLELAWWVQWLLFSALSIGSLVFFRQRIYSVLRPPPDQEIQEGVDGDSAIALDAIDPGASGRVELRGSPWNAVNTGARPVAEGERCIVASRQGLTLHITSGD